MKREIVEHVEFYIHASCIPNSRCGGFGAVMLVKSGDEVRKTKLIQKPSVEQLKTTNNRLVLKAAIYCLGQIKNCSRTLKIFSRDTYLIDSMTCYLENWKETGWKTSDGSSVINIDLWKKLDEMASELTVEWFFSRRQALTWHNEKASKLARQASNKALEMAE